VDTTNRLIWDTLNIKRGDILPFSGFNVKGKRDDFPVIFSKLGFTKGAEIGVSTGTYSKVLCDGIPNLHLLCVDPYAAYQRASQRLCDDAFARAQARLQGCPVEFIRKTSMEAVKDVPEGSLDFCFIDGDHRFDWVAMDIIEWSKRVRKGGIVSGHDYYKFYQAGVIRAVDAYTIAHGISMWYVTREMMPSWLFVKHW
jgi:hypothetical protein